MVWDGYIMPKFQITYFENAIKFIETNYPPKLLKSNADRRRCGAKQQSANDSYCDEWLLSDSSEESDGESGKEMEGDENATSMEGAAQQDLDSFDDQRQ